MNGFIEPLPGLLDDPQVQSTDLPTLLEFHIAPLRNPAPSRNSNVPSPLEPLTDNSPSTRVKNRSSHPQDTPSEARKRTPKITPTDVILARDAKKPNLTIRELVEASTATEFEPTYLPSFVSLAVVERSPVPRSLGLDLERAQKRLCVDAGLDTTSSEDYRRLPRPEQNDVKGAARPLPLLPAMVTGLHEPPLSAALLPSMDPDSHSQSTTETVAVKKMKVTTVLENAEPKSHGVPPELMLNSPEMESAILPVAETSPLLEPQDKASPSSAQYSSRKSSDQKSSRRIPRKWTDLETEQLMLGVQKYGIGKWKQILTHPGFDFGGRNTVDLKDRFRVCQPAEYKNRKPPRTRMTDLPLSQSSPNSMNIRSSHPERSESKRPSGAATGSSGDMMDGVSPESPPTDCALEPSSAPSPTPTNGKRRKRRPWTVAEDEALMKGVAKHGFQWTVIHDDAELGLSHRRATDLRDRIRNKFPDGYKHAETAPLRSERRKDSVAKPAADRLAQRPADEGSATPSGKQEKQPASEVPKSSQSGGEAAVADHPGLKLPPLTLDDGVWDWENNTLPPLLDWEDIAM